MHRIETSNGEVFVFRLETWSYLSHIYVDEFDRGVLLWKLSIELIFVRTCHLTLSTLYEAQFELHYISQNLLLAQNELNACHNMKYGFH